jgi:5-methylcytosine-specific restriction endonuclease McrA
MKCGNCEKNRKVPSPHEQHDAYVDQHDWPQEMEDAVFSEKGKSCVISGCNDKEITLDHIVPWDKNGKTSVRNLQPMCKSHNSSKGAKDFAVWLREEKLTLR